MAVIWNTFCKKYHRDQINMFIIIIIIIIIIIYSSRVFHISIS